MIPELIVKLPLVQVLPQVSAGELPNCASGWSPSCGVGPQS